MPPCCIRLDVCDSVLLDVANNGQLSPACVKFAFAVAMLPVVQGRLVSGQQKLLYSSDWC